jgi:hypothetical protein
MSMGKLVSVEEGYVERLEGQIARQKESIGRLLEHISMHHDELGQRTVESCTWIQKKWDEASTDGQPLVRLLDTLKKEDA